MKLEIKKIENKIELDTTTEGCWDDCIVTLWVASTKETSFAGLVNCMKCIWTSKGNVAF